MKSTKSAITGLTANEEKFTELLAKGYDNVTCYTEVFGVGTCSRTTLVKKAYNIAKKHFPELQLDKPGENIDFPNGSMFWFRPEAMRLLIMTQ